MTAWNHKPLANSNPRPWEDRRFAECAFPFDGEAGVTLSCCEPVVDGLQYCGPHIALMYYPNSPSRKGEADYFNPRSAGASLSKHGATRWHKQVVSPPVHKSEAT